MLNFNFHKLFIRLAKLLNGILNAVSKVLKIVTVHGERTAYSMVASAFWTASSVCSSRISDTRSLTCTKSS